MIVLDASAVVELLLGTGQGRSVAARIADPALGLHVPHLAEALDSTLLTCDGRLARSPGVSRRVELVR